ncbi:hypothetical protein [Alterisphingorhabdus coralli]|uniref:Uncharacterized protein n=1 Tax=Alterisphingorhabdus coralli TaxID=3071408 RepID=A0AA97I354_9SPHN|nr:hypothetical protein [Parasphingorhabdus sp. SCSIO 66989]WOE76415.1 hypothetical protein RB602_06800 [Parasphingorhabdus sp. SCSIO 66989]
MRKSVIALALCGTILASGCARQEPITEEELQRTPETPVVADDTAVVEETEVASETEETGAEAGPALQAMAFTEAEGVVESGLGCAFISADDEALFFVDDTANAAVKLNDTVVALKTEGEANYEAVEQGGTYATEALSITIDRAEGEGETSALETIEWSATLNVTQDEGGSRSYEGGRYSCGA